MGVFGFFRRGFDPDSFEKELTSVTESISSTNQQISRLRLRSRSIRRSLAIYSLIVYVGIISYDYTSLPSQVVGPDKLSAAFALVRVVRILFDFLIRSRENKLKWLKKKHKEKIEELKKITNFTTTEKLLNKYGDTPKKPSITPNNTNKNITAKPKQLPATANVAKPPAGQLSQQELNKLNLNITPRDVVAPTHTPQFQQNKQPQHPQQQKSVAPIRRSIQDRLLDMLIGSENNESVESRYALICYNCFTHNGLAPPGTSDPATVVYICMKCGVMNGELNEEKSIQEDHVDTASVSPVDKTSQLIDNEAKSSSKDKLEQVQAEVEERKEEVQQEQKQEEKQSEEVQQEQKQEEEQPEDKEVVKQVQQHEEQEKQVSESESKSDS
ncbi:predicted protein [Scheffersomyces stipitis CBS 6054]|uniref:Endoplasmic reticulum junction formation protein lunapark n=1 Tax=Scheffersomyces stipitis (strain ATCC 58785 / CBS 6054 / NBRC 10063 / NRRL Y-11545) TaxID=322104 RepID=A3GHD4_PICST|nr:predicted protein [Scheffersomyces stipitis CBS 6054]EAZ63036.2 predicted protein [Scheffersomyces stipitis CBS 6054]